MCMVWELLLLLRGLLCALWCWLVQVGLVVVPWVVVFGEVMRVYMCGDACAVGCWM